MITRNAAHATTVNDMSREALGRVEEGGDIVKRAIVLIGEINAASARIREISDIINDIVFQTNLLALEGIIETMKKVREIVSEITAALNGKRTGIDFINKAVARELKNIRCSVN